MPTTSPPSFRAFAPNGKFRHEVLDVLGDAANRADRGGTPAEIRELPVERARKRYEQLAEKTEEVRGETRT